MARVTNLKTFRKQKAREADRKAGDENAVRFGRSAAQKSLEEAQAAKARLVLDAHKRETDPDQ
jgi:hypothetical protein